MTLGTMTLGTLAEPVFRPVGTDDAAFLRTLRAELDADGRPGLRGARFMAGPGALDEVIEVDGVPVGRLLTTPAAQIPGGVHVVGLALLREHQGRGLGARALQRCADRAHSAHAPVTLALHVDSPALTWFRRLGLRSVRVTGSPWVTMVLDPPLGGTTR